MVHSSLTPVCRVIVGDHPITYKMTGVEVVQESHENIMGDSPSQPLGTSPSHIEDMLSLRDSVRVCSVRWAQGDGVFSVGAVLEHSLSRMPNL